MTHLSKVRFWGIGSPALFLLSSCLCPVAFGRTWIVAQDGSGDALQVQVGIDIAASGDTVLIMEGTYLERVDFKGKNIVVKSRFGPDQTILDATGLGGRVAVFQSGEGRGATLEGLTLTGGNGGILIRNAEPTIINNLITSNWSTTDGGGIGCDGNIQLAPFWRPLIKSNRITNNRAQNLGGGVLFGNDMIPEFLNNYIAGNETMDGDGGGVYFENVPMAAVPLIQGNTIEDNTAGDHGGGIYVAQIGGNGPIEIEISHNLLWKNHAKGRSIPITDNSGGGIWLWETNAWIHHNTIVENIGDGPGSAFGGGIVIDQQGSPIIEQNIVAYSTTGGGLWCGHGATPIIRDNLAWQNVGGDGVGDCPNWWQSNGNLIDNPYFCDMAGGDFTVASNSGVMTHPAGPLGAFSTPGCGPVAVNQSTWGAIKARYLSSH